jgi:tRNA A-37 threonylcarbamoyl transferase component Bud32
MANKQWKLSTSGNLKTHIKQGVSPKEYYIHSELYELSKVYKCLNVPRILNYNQDTETMTTVCVGTSNVSDFYGEESHKVPRRIFKAVRVIIQLLYDSGVVYPDITGYNFIESKRNDKTKLWIFDFEHAEVYPKKPDEFVEEFLSGTNSWNPDFK